MRIRHHVNPLQSSFLTPRGERLPLGQGSEVEVEIGCADARFLFERARQDPARLEVGLEIREELVRKVNREAQAQGLNLQAFFSNVNVDLGALFEPASVARFFVNFPDPWFKERHKKRRVVNEGLVTDMARALRPGGEVFFQSDVWDLALDALAVFEGHPRLLDNQAGSWSFWKRANPYGVRSLREVYCEEEQKPIWRILYRRRDGDPSPG